MEAHDLEEGETTGIMEYGTLSLLSVCLGWGVRSGERGRIRRSKKDSKRYFSRILRMSVSLAKIVNATQAMERHLDAIAEDLWMMM